MKVETLILGLVFPLLFLSACGTQGTNEAGPYDSSSDLAAPTGTVDFTTLSNNILKQKCIQCHSDDLATAAELLSNHYVVPGNPSASKIYQMVSSGQMPKDGAKLSDVEMSYISNYIVGLQ